MKQLKNRQQFIHLLIKYQDKLLKTFICIFIYLIHTVFFYFFCFHLFSFIRFRYTFCRYSLVDTYDFKFPFIVFLFFCILKAIWCAYFYDFGQNYRLDSKISLDILIYCILLVLSILKCGSESGVKIIISIYHSN